MIRGSNPSRGKRFFFSPRCPDRPPSLLFNGYWGSLPGVKRPRREVYHLPLSSAKVKNEWSSTGTPIWLHGMGRDNFTFVLFLIRAIPNLECFMKTAVENI
jgi:hypothetical protein